MIVVFGAGGQLGQELTAAAIRTGTPVRAVPRREADITDAAAVDRVIGETRPAMVVNAAAYNQVDTAETDREAAMAVNAEGPAILARACAAADLPFVHISTDFVFDGAKTTPYVEDDPVAPVSVYGTSKAAGEAAVRAAWSRHYILRTAWVFGVHGSNFVKTMVRLAAERDELAVVTDQVGSPTWTADLARAILRIAESDHASGRFGTYHVAGQGATSRHAFAEAIVDAQARFTDRRPAIRRIVAADFPTAARRPAQAALDTSKFRHAFGFTGTRWTDAVRQVVDQLFAGQETP